MKGTLPLRSALGQSEAVAPTRLQQGDSAPQTRALQGRGGLPGDPGQGESVSPALGFLRAAIDELQWKHDAVAAFLHVTPRYFSRMLAGEKAWTVRHLKALPDDIEARFVKKYAESFGLIVIERVDDATARQQLASGLFNLLSGSRLPTRASAMVKVGAKAKSAKAAGR